MSSVYCGNATVTVSGLYQGASLSFDAHIQGG